MTSSAGNNGDGAQTDGGPDYPDHAHEQIRESGVDTVAIERAARMFHAVGDAGRLKLMELLSQGEACVSELAEASGDGLSTVSQRLKVLHDERLVVRRREGKHVFYALSDHHVANLILNALEHAAEEAAEG